MTEFSDSATQWVVHVLGPDDVHHFDTIGQLRAWLDGALDGLSRMYPRGTDLDPMIRLVVSPPTAVLDGG